MTAIAGPKLSALVIRATLLIMLIGLLCAGCVSDYING